MAMRKFYLNKILFPSILFSLTACATTTEIYGDPNMDFGAIQSIAVSITNIHE